MARKPRIQFKNSFFHIINRGVDKRVIVKNDSDRKKFIGLIQELPNQFPLKIYAYCLMDNHYHLLLSLKEPCLPEAMHQLNLSYVSYFNKKWERVGHLFASRYKSILVENDVYLMELTRYIHLNPVRAKVVRKPQRYPWSSYADYLSLNEQSAISFDWILSMFGPNRTIAIQRYRKYVHQGLQLPEWDIEEKVGGVPAYGSKEFVKKIKGMAAACG